MAEEAAPPSPSPVAAAAAPAPLKPSKKENVRPIGTNMAEINESHAELSVKLQGLKKELLNWRSKLNTQVKTYKDELSELKNSLSTEMEQIRSQFQELRTTLQQQQDEVTKSLENLGMQHAATDTTEPREEVKDPVVKEGKAEEKPEEEQNAAPDQKEPQS